MTGQTISHYRILEKLGEGGMGVVYKAEDIKLRRQVALKFLASDFAGDETVRRRFLHEAQAAAALSHPNICVVHEVDEDNGFLGLEYVQGETVAAKIARRPLPLEEALDIAIQAGHGLEAAHEKQIVHRDVKSPNLMVTTAGQVKVMDFGLAQLRGHSQITQTGTRLGTLAYMSPEQFRGESVDRRTDIWSLGVVLYEMLAGALPFAGDSDASILYSVLNKEPEALSARRADVPPGLDRVLNKALAKERDRRYQHIADLLVDLKALQKRGLPIPVAGSKPGGRKALVAAVLIAAVAAAGIWIWRQRVRAGREQAFQQAVELYNAGQSIPAYKLAKRLDGEIPTDPRTLRLWEQVGVFYSLSTEPAGADVSIRELGKADSEWIPLGKTPLVKVRVPLETNLHLRVKMEGYEVVERAGYAHFLPSELKLAKAGSWPEGMVPIPGGGGVFLGRQAAVDDFWLDKYETTNAQFKIFLDAGGYREKRFWKYPFVEGGKQLAWEQAMARFIDATGRPGPATWELGMYPEGKAGYPVSGVSWYEAAAFAEFAGKELPTVFHWGRAAIDAIAGDILNVSNFSGKGPAPVGQYRGVSPFGVYDVAGNVKEWCLNQTGDRRHIMGLAWNEPSYSLALMDGASPFERNETMGFRCAKYNLKPAAVTLEPFERRVRDYSKEKPVPDEVFRAYRSLYSYDRGPLEAKVEGVDEREPGWRVEKVTFNTADGGDRMIVYLYLPLKATPPYQTVIHFPGSYAFNLAQINNLSLLYVRYFIQSGRALAFPIFDGTYERRARVPSSGPHSVRDRTIRWSKELGRTIDYLETRRDLDSSRLVFHGFSLGAGLGVLPLLGVEQRLKFAILLAGGFPHGEQLSEVDPINFMPRARMPVLMINGDNDFGYPMETAQKPLLRFLGSPPEHKRHAVFEGGHVVPRNAMIKESLDWLDRYLGPVRLAP